MPLFFAPFSTNIALIHKGISKTMCNIKKLDEISASSLMLYLHNDQAYKASFAKNVLILFRKSHYIGDLHYLVLFFIRTIPGIALIETVLTGDPLYMVSCPTRSKNLERTLA